MSKKLKIISVLAVLLISCICILINNNVIAIDFSARVWIDSPKEGELTEGKLVVSGWKLSEDENASLKILIDEKEMEIEQITTRPRPDVISAIPGYGGIEKNPEPGYAATIDVSKIKDGEHILKTQIISSEGNLLAEQSRIINIKGQKARTYTDTPKQNAIITGDQLIVSGWIMSTDENRTLKILIDEKEMEIAQIATRSRPDVISAIPGYGDEETNPEPGYATTIDISKIKDGEHELKVQIISSNDEVLAEDIRSITIEKYKARTYTDSPKQDSKIEGTELIVSGWIMSNDKNRTLKIYIDGKEQTIEQITTRPRPDVISAVPGYGDEETNPEPGYATTIDISKIKDGEHELKVQIISSNDETLVEDTRNITIEKYKARTYTDSPKQDSKIEGTELIVSGWIMSNDKNRTLKIYIDGKEQTIEQITTRPRPDVINAVPGYGDEETNPEPGYATTINIKDISDGNHILKVQITSSNEELLVEETRNIYIEKYKAKMYIDTPKENWQLKNTIDVSGWVMSTYADKEIKVFINNEQQTLTNFSTRPRPDVISVIPGYGDEEINPEPGFAATIDVSEKTAGKYILKVQVVTKTGKVLAEQEREIIIYNNYDVGIDVSKWNGKIDWAKVKQTGINFAMIRAGNRGYGTEGKILEDPTFVENMRGAIANGIEVGVYFYSQAINETEVIEEAELTLRMIRENGFGNNITFPVVIDTERSGGRGDTISKEQRTNLVKIFCEKIKQAGYKPMVYANKDWLINNLNMSQLSEYDVWLAHYTGTDDPVNNPSNYNGNYQIWQYTDNGNVDGINSKVDMNISYKKYFK